jgi:hypothetical protein
VCATEQSLCCSYGARIRAKATWTTKKAGTENLLLGSRGIAYSTLPIQWRMHPPLLRNLGAKLATSSRNKEMKSLGEDKELKFK